MDQLKKRWPESHLPIFLELIRTRVAWVCPTEQMKALDEGMGLGHLHSCAIGCLQGWWDLSQKKTKNKKQNSMDGPLDSWWSHSPKWRCGCSHWRNNRGALPTGLSGELTKSPPLKKKKYLLNTCQAQRAQECTCYSGKIFFPSSLNFPTGQHWEVIFRTLAR